MNFEQERHKFGETVENLERNLNKAVAEAQSKISHKPWSVKYLFYGQRVQVTRDGKM